MNAHVRGPIYITQSVRDHREKVRATLDRLRAGAGAAVLSVALNEEGAEKRLADLRAKIASAEFQLQHLDGAVHLANARDGEAQKAWSAARFDLSTDELLQGLGKEECPRLCQKGTFGGCVISAGCADPGGRCLHPVLEQVNFPIANDYEAAPDGKLFLQFPFSYHPKAAEIFKAACQKLRIERFK